MVEKKPNSSPLRKRVSKRSVSRTEKGKGNKGANSQPSELAFQTEAPVDIEAKPRSIVRNSRGDFSKYGRLTSIRDFLGQEKKVTKFFISVFSILIVFFLGTTFGRSGNESVVDNAIDEILTNSPSAIDRGTLERAAIEGALRASGDEWANYFPTSTLTELNKVTSNVMTGAGITITRTRSGALTIADVEDESPADSAGLQIGDQIISVNGTNVQGEPATKVAAMIRATPKKSIAIVVNRGAAILEFSLKIEPVEFKTVEGAQIARGVAYLAISSFSSGTATELSSVMGELDSSRGVVIDLRDNPGGLLSEMVSVAERFIGNGVIVSYKVNGEEKVFTAKNSQPNKSPVILLINRGTASSAEILAAAFQDRNRGVVIGERSYGKGSVQEFVTLSDGSKLELTVALYLTPLGRTIESTGVTPDLEVSDSELATKALQILGGLAQLGSDVAEGSQ